MFNTLFWTSCRVASVLATSGIAHAMLVPQPEQIAPPFVRSGVESGLNGVDSVSLFMRAITRNASVSGVTLAYLRKTSIYSPRLQEAIRAAACSGKSDAKWAISLIPHFAKAKDVGLMRELAFTATSEVGADKYDIRILACLNLIDMACIPGVDVWSEEDIESSDPGAKLAMAQKQARKALEILENGEDKGVEPCRLMLRRLSVAVEEKRSLLCDDFVCAVAAENVARVRLSDDTLGAIEDLLAFAEAVNSGSCWRRSIVGACAESLAFLGCPAEICRLGSSANTVDEGKIFARAARLWKSDIATKNRVLYDFESILGRKASDRVHGEVLSYAAIATACRSGDAVVRFRCAVLLRNIGESIDLPVPAIAEQDLQILFEQDKSNLCRALYNATIDECVSKLQRVDVLSRLANP